MAKKSYDEEDPQLRMDILAYRLLNMGMQMLERSHGLNGLAENMKPFLEQGVRETFRKKTKIPNEVRLLGEMLFRKRDV